MSSRYDLQMEKLKVHQEVTEGRRDLRNNIMPYFDVHQFGVHHYSDIQNGIIKLLKNAEYLIDEIYYRIPTRFIFFYKHQYRKFDDGSISCLSDYSWEQCYYQETAKNTTLKPVPEGPYEECYDFERWNTDAECSSGIDFNTKTGPVSAYASYTPKTYHISFLDYYGQEISEISSIQDISSYLSISAFGDDTGISTKNRDIHDKISESLEAYSDLSLYLYDLDQDYPNSLSNVRQDYQFRGKYVDRPAYQVFNYYGQYDGQPHGISVLIHNDGEFKVGCSRSSDGPFTSDISNIVEKYTQNEEISVYFNISAYNRLLGEYKQMLDEPDHGTIRIFKRYLKQEENPKYILTDSDKLSILV